MKQVTPHSDPYPIRGDTVGKRKRDVQRLLQERGYTAAYKEIGQQKGTLFLHWVGPFDAACMKQLTRFADVAQVSFNPDPEQAYILSVDIIFEREAGLFFFDPLTRCPVILTSLDRLPVLCAEYLEWKRKYQERSARIQAQLDEEPEQTELFPNEA